MHGRVLAARARRPRLRGMPQRRTTAYSYSVQDAAVDLDAVENDV